ncbi:EamA-like transporter family protein [Pigmentiphaga humi]|uniref:EamA-like transporter family protein n=1 Tax=Pigmentiphaga humi TaxID=2478468 RepID=A0A3P4B1U3_9BURK|nr:DMT family transporter [Pigmentiphaga humi]VCU70259.1 EamA-like transporter family protein [Pigmentiphaga humi]
MDISLLWIPATLIAAAAQTARNTMQHRLTETLGTLGAAQVRFLYGLPFAVLFLSMVVAVGGEALPRLHGQFLLFAAAGAVLQIVATVLMLATMQLRNFALSTVYVKTEPLLVAVFAVLVLGDPLTALGACAVVVATGGVIIMSWRPGAGAGGNWRPALLGIASGACFALSAVAFRGSIVSLESGSFVLRASTALVVGLVMQTGALVVWQCLFRRDVLRGVLQAWRTSLPAGFMGAFASQCWYIGFALTSAANVRTLGLVEVLFAQIASRRIFAQHASPRERWGMAWVVAGLVLLLYATRS